MQNEHSVAGHWPGGFDEAGLQAWAEQLRGRLIAGRASLGLVFMSPRFFGQAAQVLELLRVHAQIPLLAGCSSPSLIAGDQEVEGEAGLVLGLYSLPGATLEAVHFTQEQVEEASGPGYWHMETGIGPEQINGWLTFADPFHLDGEAWLRGWNEAYAPLPIAGGLATGDAAEQQRTQVYLNGQVWEEGGVGIAIGGEIALASVISQGCTPIGDTWTITKAERNLIHEIGNRSAYEVLAETVNQLPEKEQRKSRGNLFVGLVINEYLEDFHRGDFLIRNLIGADPKSGRTPSPASSPSAPSRGRARRSSSSAATPPPAPRISPPCWGARASSSPANRSTAPACAVAMAAATGCSASRATTPATSRRS